MLNKAQIREFLLMSLAHNISLDIAHNSDKYSDIYFIDGSDKNNHKSVLFNSETLGLSRKIGNTLSKFITDNTFNSVKLDTEIFNKLDTLTDLVYKVLFETKDRFSLNIDPELMDIWLIDELDNKTYLSDSPLIHLDRITSLTVKVNARVIK